MSEINLLTNYKPKFNYFPLLSISGISLLSLGGIILLKSKTKAALPVTNLNQPPQIDLQPTQVPKSIQHYLLASQQYFSQALTAPDQNNKINLINQSILTATEAIKNFPNDYRGYHQRGRIYQSLIGNQPEFLDQCLTDLSAAFKLNSSSAEITHDLATVYAQKGDAINTINYLIQTVALEPTKAQNFYDLAKIQQQAGYFADALATYQQLLTLVSDPNQKQQLEIEKTALEKIVASNPRQPSSISPIDNQQQVYQPNSPLIQSFLPNHGLIIAAPETIKEIKVKNQTDSNSFSGNSYLPAGQTTITIKNSQIVDDSQIYVVTIKGGKNQNLRVLSKTTGSFTVGFDSPITEDVEFKWWIIN